MEAKSKIRDYYFEKWCNYLSIDNAESRDIRYYVEKGIDSSSASRMLFKVGTDTKAKTVSGVSADFYSWWI